jgi:hypothetical protein
MNGFATFGDQSWYPIMLLCKMSRSGLAFGLFLRGQNAEHDDDSPGRSQCRVGRLLRADDATAEPPRAAGFAWWQRLIRR